MSHDTNSEYCLIDVDEIFYPLLNITCTLDYQCCCQNYLLNNPNYLFNFMQLMPNLSTKMDELTLLEISIYSRINNKLSHMHKRTQELACECVMFEWQCSDWASA